MKTEPDEAQNTLTSQTTFETFKFENWPPPVCAKTKMDFHDSLGFHDDNPHKKQPYWPCHWKMCLRKMAGGGLPSYLKNSAPSPDFRRRFWPGSLEAKVWSQDVPHSVLDRHVLPLRFKLPLLFLQLPLLGFKLSLSLNLTLLLLLELNLLELRQTSKVFSLSHTILTSFAKIGLRGKQVTVVQNVFSLKFTFVFLSECLYRVWIFLWQSANTCCCLSCSARCACWRRYSSCWRRKSFCCC